MMKKRENGQALVDFLLLLVILIGIPLGLLFRYNVQLRNVSVRVVRTMGMTIRNWRGGARRPAKQCKTAPAAEKKTETPAPQAEVKTPAMVTANEAKPAAPAAASCPDKAAVQTAPAAPAK